MVLQIQEKKPKPSGRKWVSVDMIAKGEFTKIYLATPRLGQTDRSGYPLPSLLAVKSAEISDSRFLQREAEVLSKLQGCPYIIKYYADETVFEDNGRMIYNVLLEYASGGTLEKLIMKSNGCGVAENDARRYTRSLLSGLRYIHSRGYVHRNIGSMNVLLVDKDCGFDVKIADFGSARKMEKAPWTRYRDGFSYVGTLIYASPESISEYKQDPPADIWALGCVVVEMLSGKHVWGSESDVDDLLDKIADGEAPEIPSGISKEGRDFLKRCFVKNSDFRWTADMLLCHPFVSGEYLATGEKLNGVEMITCALATHYFLNRLALIEDQLGKLTTDDPSIVESSLEQYGDLVFPEKRSVLHRIETIDKCFGRDTVEEIVDALGIQAGLVDKDYTPKWDPLSSSLVSKDMVAYYFAPFSVSELEPELELPTATREPFV